MRTIFLAAAGLAALAGAAFAQERHGRGLEHLFQADANHDGAVTRAEFDAGRDAMFGRMDADNDGQLAGGEHRRGHHSMGGGHEGADANGDGAISRDEFLARPLAMFARLDANNDGSISAEEQTQMRARHNERREARQERRQARPSHDSNGDHQLSRAEFAAMGASHFERLDANHDGSITRAEAEAAHAAHGGGGDHH